MNYLQSKIAPLMKINYKTISPYRFIIGFSIGVAVIIASCNNSTKSKLVGKWHDTFKGSTNIIEFFNDETVYWYGLSYKLDILEDGRMRMVSPIQTNIYNFEIHNDTLSFHDQYHNYEFKKMK